MSTIKKLILLLLVIFIFIGGFIAANFISIPQAKEQSLKEVKLQTNNPQIIYNKFKQVRELITQKGSVTYTNTIVDDGFWGDKKIDLNLKYNYGLGIDLNKLVVKSIVGDTVLIQIPQYELKLKYLELDVDSQVTSTKSLLAQQFKPEDVHIILQQSQQKVADSINLNRSMYGEAFERLQREIERMVMALGFSSVIIEIV